MPPHWRSAEPLRRSEQYWIRPTPELAGSGCHPVQSARPQSGRQSISAATCAMTQYVPVPRSCVPDWTIILSSERIPTGTSADRWFVGVGACCRPTADQQPAVAHRPWLWVMTGPAERLRACPIASSQNSTRKSLTTLLVLLAIVVTAEFKRIHPGRRCQLVDRRLQRHEPPPDRATPCHVIG